jgi:hypothetical protein
MEPITSALAAISAASSAISFIKARVNDVQSVSELSGQISTLFSAQKVLNEKRNEQAGVSDVSASRAALIQCLRRRGSMRKCNRFQR